MPRQVSGSYDYRSSGQVPSSTSNFLFNDGKHVKQVSPKWKRTENIFRFLPVNDGHGGFSPFALSNEAMHYGDFIRRYAVIRYLGTNKIHFVIADPREGAAAEGQSPAWVLFRNLDRAVRNGAPGLRPEWNALVLKPSQGMPLIKRPESLFFTQGLVMELGSDVQNPPMGATEDSPMPVITFSAAAGESLNNQMETMRTSQEGFDLIDPRRGAFVAIHQSGTRSVGTAGGNMWNASASSASAKNNEFEHYDVVIDTTYRGNAPSIPDDWARQILSRTVAWDELIRMPTDEEQIQYICASGIPVDAIIYALDEQFHSLIPKRIRDQYRSEVAPPSAGYHQQHANVFNPQTPPTYPLPTVNPGPAASTNVFTGQPQGGLFGAAAAGQLPTSQPSGSPMLPIAGLAAMPLAGLAATPFPVVPQSATADAPGQPAATSTPADSTTQVGSQPNYASPDRVAQVQAALAAARQAARS